MSIAAAFIKRPVATTLLTIGVALAGAAAFFRLPVAPLPQVDFPTISIMAQMPGASPETMATSVATPLERRLGSIADVTEITSSSSTGSTRITLQFGLNRDINGAARDVQAAINAARVDLPANLRSNPTYRKVNPADLPVMILALTSKTMTQGQLYDSAATVLQQKLAQVEGVGEVQIGGSSLPAVRVGLNPTVLNRYGIGSEDVRAAIAAANANSPKGAIELGDQRWQIYANDQARGADQYRDLIIAYRNKAPVRLGDLADVQDSVEDLRNQGLANGSPSVLCIITREPGANIIETVDRIRDLIPNLKASIPADIELTVAMERTTTIRASLREVESALTIAVALVVLVVFAFLRSWRATLIPAVAVPVSLIGTFGVMWLCGYSLNNLSLMALTIATGFVVDDAIVVMENIARHIEEGKSRMEAALLGAREVSFTVISISISLIAVFLPILMMGGIVGRLFREFAMVLSTAILVSLIVSLTTTPMMCAYILPVREHRTPGRIARASEAAFDAMLRGYARTLDWSLRHAWLVLLIFIATIGLNVWLYVIVPKGFFPQQDTGRLQGFVRVDQSTSFPVMRTKLTQFQEILRNDRAVDSVVGFASGAGASAMLFIQLKPLKERRESSDAVITRLRPQLAEIPGAQLFLSVAQDLRAGGRQSSSDYQFTLQGDSVEDLTTWAPKLAAAMENLPQITDANSDQQQRGLQIDINLDRDALARLGLSPSQVNNALYGAFGQRQVTTIYNPLNQYHVVMESAADYRQTPQVLAETYVSASGGAVSGSQATNALVGSTTGSTAARAASGTAAATTAATITTSADDLARNQRANQLSNVAKRGASTGSAVSTNQARMVPLPVVATWKPGTTALSIQHQGLFVATTVSFNLAEGVALSEAVAAIDKAMNDIGMPSSIVGSFQGTARLYQQTISTQPLLILAALMAVYLVLGMLYESLVHPLTILSTLPPAGVGAVIALIAADTEFSLIALIGVILLIGIVKKNAIMMIDFALDAERSRGLDSHQSIREACLLRFRPILMTTLAALLGAVPLAIGSGDGAELRRPLGIAIVGGLIFSQLLTLYTTPVIYLYLDRLRLGRLFRRRTPRHA